MNNSGFLTIPDGLIYSSSQTKKLIELLPEETPRLGIQNEEVFGSFKDQKKLREAIRVFLKEKKDLEKEEPVSSFMAFFWLEFLIGLFTWLFNGIQTKMALTRITQLKESPGIASAHYELQKASMRSPAILICLFVALNCFIYDPLADFLLGLASLGLLLYFSITQASKLRHLKKENLFALVKKEATLVYEENSSKKLEILEFISSYLILLVFTHEKFNNLDFRSILSMGLFSGFFYFFVLLSKDPIGDKIVSGFRFLIVCFLLYFAVIEIPSVNGVPALPEFIEGRWSIYNSVIGNKFFRVFFPFALFVGILLKISEQARKHLKNSGSSVFFIFQGFSAISTMLTFLSLSLPDHQTSSSFYFLAGGVSCLCFLLLVFLKRELNATSRILLFLGILLNLVLTFSTGFAPFFYLLFLFVMNTLHREAQYLPSPFLLFSTLCYFILADYFASVLSQANTIMAFEFSETYFDFDVLVYLMLLLRETININGFFCLTPVALVAGNLSKKLQTTGALKHRFAYIEKKDREVARYYNTWKALGFFQFVLLVALLQGLLLINTSIKGEKKQEMVEYLFGINIVVAGTNNLINAIF